MSKKAEIRQAAFNYDKTPATIPFLDFEVTVKVPTIGEWGEVVNESAQLVSDGRGRMEVKSDGVRRKVMALTQFVFDEDGEHVFEKADADLIAGAPVGSPIDKLAEDVLELCEPDEDEARGK